MTWPSTYTHDPERGERIDQYALPVEPFVRFQPDFQRSGMRHYRSTLQAGQTSDNIHIVEQWGQNIVPYEQWRFPYRPYGVPYDQWGPQAPYGIINSQIGIQPPYYPGYPGGGNARPGYPGHGYPGPHPPGGGSRPDGYGPQQPRPNYPDPGYPGGQPYPGHHGYPNYPHPGNRGYPGYGGGGYPGQPSDYSRGFPLTPQYNGEPWYDGNYPAAPPLRAR